MNGAKRITEALACNYVAWVGERSARDTSLSVSTNAARRSEYVGISNEKTGEIPVRRKPKGS